MAQRIVECGSYLIAQGKDELVINGLPKPGIAIGVYNHAMRTGAVGYFNRPSDAIQEMVYAVTMPETNDGLTALMLCRLPLIDAGINPGQQVLDLAQRIAALLRERGVSEETIQSNRGKYLYDTDIALSLNVERGTMRHYKLKQDSQDETTPFPRSNRFPELFSTEQGF